MTEHPSYLSSSPSYPSSSSSRPDAVPEPDPGPAPGAPGGRHLLVFLHGVGSTPMSFSDQVAKLPPGIEASCPWLRGTRPGSKDVGFSLADAAAEVVTSLELAGASVSRPAWLCGVSAGAMVALAVAEQRPDLVEALVLVGGQVATPRALMRMQRRLMGLLPRSFYAGKGLDKRRTLAALDDLARVDLGEGLPRVAARTLVVCGSRDRANQPAARRLAGEIPGARLVLVEGAGHEVNIDRPAEFNEVLYGFLLGRGPAGGDGPAS